MTEKVAFDATVLTGAFLKPGSVNFRLLELAARGGPMFEGFVTDSVGAEFWWRTTQKGLVLRGQTWTWPEKEVEDFLDVFDPLFRPDQVRQAPIGRELGSRAAGLEGQNLGEVLHAITGLDRDALLTRFSDGPRASVQEFDLNDLHVVSGAMVNGATELCSSDSDLNDISPIGSLIVQSPSTMAVGLGLIPPPSARESEAEPVN